MKIRSLNLTRINRSITILVMLFVMTTLVVLGQQADYFISNGRTVDTKSFNSEIEKMMMDIGIPAASLAVIEKGKIVFATGYGLRQPSQNLVANRETVFEACSLSKSYLVFVAHQLAQEGKLDLDKPMYQYIDPGTVLNHDIRYKLITPRMILSHASGIENWQSDNDKNLLEIVGEPGKEFVYSGTGYNYLADVLSLILNQSYEEYIEERVIKPLGLKNSYLKFEIDTVGSTVKEVPSNYAVGHGVFDEELQKWKNPDPVPASGNNVSAEDYAKLIIATFDKKHLTPKTVKEVLKPVVSTGTNNGHTYYYGMGYEIFFQKDTIVNHGGDNGGFKAQVFYSLTSGNGFVFLTNSDKGKWMTMRVNELSAGLDIRHYYEGIQMQLQYPSQSIKFLTAYRTAGIKEMQSIIEFNKKNHSLEPHSLEVLADMLMRHDPVLSKQLVEESVVLEPSCYVPYWLGGRLDLMANNYEAAMRNLQKAIEINGSPGEMAGDLKQCIALQADAERRKPLLVKISSSGKQKIEVEDYNEMSGIELGQTEDEGGGQSAGYLDAQDWMDYNISVASAGIYVIDARVAGLDGGRLEISTGSTSLTKLDIAGTGGWDKWTTIKTTATLEEGKHTLRLKVLAPGFNINWLQLSKLDATKTGAINPK